MELFIITGMSGAGKSAVVKIFEDCGYYCVDNIPPKILPIIANIGQNGDAANVKKLAIVVDARSREMWGDLSLILEGVEKDHANFSIMFLDASTDVLFSRYRETRHRHPMLDEDSSVAKDLREAIEAERKFLSELKNEADYLIDTSETRLPELRQRIMNILDKRKENKPMSITCVSFGFKNGLPAEADLVFDMRCLKNPHYVPELKPHTGEDPAVRDYIMDSQEAQEFIEKIEGLLDFSVPLYIREGKSQLVIAIGCTGGKHRSVATAVRLCDFLTEKGYHARAVHRDKSKNLQR
ncbi:MAG: RNase adapter RapZ [Defluviitaleaceae bacterium]|nr:RNase adapter RapZ [Defluviitaleaceae bacterium]